MWASGAGSSAASGKFCDGTNARAKLRGKPSRLTTGLLHFAHVPRLSAGAGRWRRKAMGRRSGSVTDTARKYVTSANGLRYAFWQIVQWQKNRPIGRPWTAKREAPQRQAQSWFTTSFRLAVRARLLRNPLPEPGVVTPPRNPRDNHADDGGHRRS